MSVEKLYKLCIPFCSLAATLLNQNVGKMLPFQHSPYGSTHVCGSQAEKYHNCVPAEPQYIPQVLSTDSRLESGQTGSTHDIIAPCLHYNSLGLDDNSTFDTDPFVWDFMSSQPMLQWLDYDFPITQQL